MNKEAVIKQFDLSKVLPDRWISLCFDIIKYDNGDIAIVFINPVSFGKDSIKALNYIVDHPEEFFE
jgi:hypothetical protein